MSKFNYKGRDAFGEPIQGDLEAISQQEAAKKLTAQGLFPTEISAKGLLVDFSGLLLNWGGHVNNNDLLIFFKQLGVLISAGVTIFESLAAVEEQLSEGCLKSVVANLKTEIELGATLSEALARHQQTFSPLMISMVQAGEGGGVMEEVIHKIASFLEKDIKFYQNVKNALRYPTIILGVLSVAFVLMIAFIIPRFSAVFSTFKTELPLPTRILLGFNYVIVNYWWLLISLSGLALFSLRWYIGTKVGRLRWDGFLLKLPLIGKLIKKLSLARFFRMLSSMISSGVPIEHGLEISADTADNLVIARAVLSIRERVIMGTSLSQAMKGSGLFPVTSVHMIAVGERSGSLDKMLLKSADYFSEEADYTVSNLMAYFEPLLILVMAIFVLLFAMGVFLPMWDTIKLYSTH
ncbi:hypothetical protein A2291_06920 [candidate division WOR-1 bacterium RIFOXYB2_FULL_42_35]|uniref:Type II secretion system protein GspF domain-containing protein n=1 Tax=candidate division WOR-1 bacterium RIFOXYC2_FULL_41_25 TaxID=1802586 RepID=A0A1F4TPS1_UNCSA|nr:MAG: hypothetical protein A2291_06920 [candidate division WOR-1 bacterium RIFOXYB2_FULL_42_35]OGC24610.1 MAG: hypothetical protein A2247_06700 [candidate division WOR-1 bacterium RIFOXYA2_FULL_41_14]OGC34656.1 MAG: hypothetical protein A2462_04935 [candidate division WOR-1 bacterium RIFOXYC2_FULL_41_25]OGC41605.1 MAG: hypothetical protein A2548_01255 [candidate division WOR-1 bacterium RIFOXYD2_FULL_41_8]